MWQLRSCGSSSSTTTSGRRGHCMMYYVMVKNIDSCDSSTIKAASVDIKIG